MIDVSAWAPYVSNPLTLVAFVLLVILLAMLKAPASSTFLKVLGCILIVAVTAALVLAGFSEYKRHEKPDVASAGTPAPASIAPPVSTPALPPAKITNVQTVQGSHNVLINGSGNQK